MVTPNPENPYIKTLQTELDRIEHMRKMFHRAWIINLSIATVLMIIVLGVPWFYILFGNLSTTTDVGLLLLQIFGSVMVIRWFDGVRDRYYEMVTYAESRSRHIRTAMYRGQENYDEEFRILLEQWRDKME